MAYFRRPKSLWWLTSLIDLDDFGKFFYDPFVSESLKTPAFLLQSFDLGESDRLLTFYTQKEGKVKGVARAAKKSRKRFGGALDWFHLVKLHYRAPKQAQGELLRIESLDFLWKSQKISQDLNCYGLGSYYLELVRELTHWHHPEPDVFDLLHLVLRRLEDSAGVTPLNLNYLKDLSRFFEMNLLDLLGFRPVLDHCVHCQESLTNLPQKVSLCVHRGGIFCKKCQRNQKGPFENVSLETIQALKETLQSTKRLQELNQRVTSHQLFPHFSKKAHQEARKILGDLISLHTQKPMRSLEFLKSLH